MTNLVSKAPQLCLPAGPRRIVCLTEESTELLYLLGEQERIVGISAYTVRPTQAKEDKPVVSAFIGGSVDKICALKPDLVIGFSDIQAQLAKELIAHNLSVLIFNQRSVQEVLEVIDSIGCIVHQRSKARSLIEDYLQRVERAADRGAKHAEQVGRRRRVYFEEWDEPMISGIQWVSELIEIAGGADIFVDRSTGKLAKDRFTSAQEVCERDPEIVFASWCGKAFDRSSFGARPGFAELSAVKSGRIYEVPPEIILQPGPAALTDGLDFLERHIQQK